MTPRLRGTRESLTQRNAPDKRLSGLFSSYQNYGMSKKNSLQLFQDDFNPRYKLLNSEHQRDEPERRQVRRIKKQVGAQTALHSLNEISTSIPKQQQTTINFRVDDFKKVPNPIESFLEIPIQIGGRRESNATESGRASLNGFNQTQFRSIREEESSVYHTTQYDEPADESAPTSFRKLNSYRKSIDPRDLRETPPIGYYQVERSTQFLQRRSPMIPLRGKFAHKQPEREAQHSQDQSVKLITATDLKNQFLKNIERDPARELKISSSFQQIHLNRMKNVYLTSLKLSCNPVKNFSNENLESYRKRLVDLKTQFKQVKSDINQNYEKRMHDNAHHN